MEHSLLQKLHWKLHNNNIIIGLKGSHLVAFFLWLISEKKKKFAFLFGNEKIFSIFAKEIRNIMKESSQFLRKNEIIKFSNFAGTHTMKIDNVEKCCKGREVKVTGTIIETTNEGKCKISSINVGHKYFNFFRAKTKVQIVK